MDLPPHDDHRETPQSTPMAHDSMVTVRLSEPPSLTVNTAVGTEHAGLGREEKIQDTSDPARIEEQKTPDIHLEDAEDEHRETSPRITTMDPNGNEVTSPTGSESGGSQDGESKRASDSSEASEGGVNWEELEKTEEQEPRDEGSDDSTALLLARLEQENNLLATNPKSGIAKAQVAEKQRARGQSRPPSIQHLKRLVNGPTPPALRYSLIPAPPMTDLEFYAALVQDYTRTAQCLPTLLSKKIRSGVPPPLRGVVWQSMSGARDALLEEQYERMSGESSPYEGIIGKDLGRSFPGVEMFRDPDGEGQRMLGKVLRCFSLYDHKIGYCQGLAFIVGPLLMHMGDKQAFCVLVRLMEHYDLRSCFLPDLSGLHVRIHQFRELLKTHLPNLSARLDELQIEPAGLWDCYHYNADEFVNDFVSLTGVVTHESLQALEASFKDLQAADVISPSAVGSAASRFLGRLWAGSNSSTKSTNLTPMMPAPTRPVSFLRRSPSKQSIASTLNSIEGGGSDSMMSSTTDATSISRESSNIDSSSIRAPSTTFPSAQKLSNNKDKNLHGQIEDLLTALSEMQRDHAILVTQLQKEREEREEDRQAVRSLLDGLKKKASSETFKSSESDQSVETVKLETAPVAKDEEGDETLVPEVRSDEKRSEESSAQESSISAEELSHLLSTAEERFAEPLNTRRSSLLQSKSQLKEDLVRSKEQLIIEVSKTQEFSRRLSEQEQELSNLRDQVREGHLQIRNAHAERQRLEKHIRDLRSRSIPPTPDGNKEVESEWPARASGGLREFKLGRQNSIRTQAPTFNKRSSSLNAAAILQKESEPSQIPTPPTGSGTSTPPPRSDVDADSLVLELVQAKTAEAIAKQEAEEAKAKLESLRKLLGMPTATVEGVSGHRASPSQPMIERSATMSLGFGGYMSKPKIEIPATPAVASAVTPATTSAGGGFWGGWGKRTVSTEKVPGQGGN
ncbi:hypothetical protein B7494_g1651 [Chlorociboria aeruginascens]|nr:hypothetical protein B7494_g1651 [Chlorociboria aeruginascens]